MIPNFQIALLKLLKWEGGRVDDPADPGGRTHLGITQKAWDEFRMPFKPLDVWDISVPHAEFFYFQKYWKPMHLDEVKSQPLVDTLLSFGVNQGARTAIRRLQQILRVPQDGVIGPATIKRMDTFDLAVLNGLFLNVTVEFYNRLITRRPELVKFEKGWKARVVDYRIVRREA